VLREKQLNSGQVENVEGPAIKERKTRSVKKKGIAIGLMMVGGKGVPFLA